MSKKPNFGPKIMKKSIFYHKIITDGRVPKFVSSKDGKLIHFVASSQFYGRLRCAIAIIGRCGFSTSFATNYCLGIEFK